MLLPLAQHPAGGADGLRKAAEAEPALGLAERQAASSDRPCPSPPATPSRCPPGEGRRAKARLWRGRSPKPTCGMLGPAGAGIGVPSIERCAVLGLHCPAKCPSARSADVKDGASVGAWPFGGQVIVARRLTTCQAVQLLDRDGLRQVARLVDVQRALARDVIGQQLEGDDREDGLQQHVGLRACRRPPRRARRPPCFPRWRSRTRVRRARGPLRCWTASCPARRHRSPRRPPGSAPPAARSGRASSHPRRRRRSVCRRPP